ncbi:MAG: hypothetical protein ACFE94_18265 [Candidatus Hodarchaeota archaeon]
MRLYKISEKGELIQLDKLSFEENDVYLVDDEKKNTIYIWVGSKVQQEKKDITAETARKLDKERGGSTKILIMKEKREYGSFLAMMHHLKKGLIPGVSIERRPEFVFEVSPEKIESIKLDGTPEEREIKVETRLREWLTQIKEHRSLEPGLKADETSETVKVIKTEKSSAEKEYSETFLAEKITQKEALIEQVEEPEFKTQIREAAYYFSLKKYTYNELCWLLAERIQKINLELPSIEDIRKKAEEVFNSSCSYDELCWLISEIDILTKMSYLEEKKKKSYF